nr:hypothetical protein [Tanacetum cinerariifolium]
MIATIRNFTFLKASGKGPTISMPHCMNDHAVVTDVMSCLGSMKCVCDNLYQEILEIVPGYTRTTIRVKYEWTPTRCESCKIFGNTDNQCSKNVNVSKPSVASNKDQRDGFTDVRRKRSNNRKFEVVNASKKFVYRPKQATNVGSTRKDYSKEASTSRKQNMDANLVKTATTFDILAQLDDGQKDNTTPNWATNPNVANPVSTSSYVHVGDDSESDVDDLFDETRSFMASKQSKNGGGYRTKNLYERWK